ncbi:hypothetical protein UUU_07070 [Klebsiella pneumoniae subsp. pneumoniae DSM 30104 = JCM 1662 = NBRC 14940]|nr:hypothetical protein UUU_07070 [Klebsiella pneumoniae subsp. pneumoniae DSM 30104 = JCM 1662 = NBRC 14940]
MNSPINTLHILYILLKMHAIYRMHLHAHRRLIFTQNIF